MLAHGALAGQFLKLRCRDTLSQVEEDALQKACSGTGEFGARHVIVRAEQPLTSSNLLVEGIVARQITLPDGRRQIVAIHVPGDFVDLHSFLLKRLEHDIETLTPCKIAYFPHSGLTAITENHPHLARMLWLTTLIDAAAHREWVLSVGRRTARERVAHLFCELYKRLEVTGRTKDGTFSLGINQTDLADACGLTPVHVNRTLRELRDDGLVTFRRGTVHITDFERLADSCEFDPFYLYLGAEPR